MELSSEISHNKALTKIRHYCAYQERCSFEVKNKLIELQISPHLINNYIAQLKDENFINDERYCKIFAIGKYKHTKWGKLKIRAALKQKMLPDDFIDNALSEIPENDYINLLFDLYQKRIKTKSATNQEKAKVIQYLVSKGFERNLILICAKK
jgi:regulatory protein